MGKKADAALMAALQAAINKAQQPSPFETQWTNEYNALSSWLNGKDYRNLPVGANVNMIPLAEQQRMRQMIRGSGDMGGTVAKRGMNSMALARQKELDDNQFAGDWAGAYEEKVGVLMNQKMGMGQNLQSMYSNRMNQGIQGAAMNLDAYRNRPKGFNWGQLLGGAIQGGASLASAFI